LSHDPIGSPIVLEPDILIAMNLPSFHKFEPAVRPGGVLLADSSLIGETSARADISAFYVPATRLASDGNMNGLANMILVGKLLCHVDLIQPETIPAAMANTVPASKQALLEKNLQAIALGQRSEKNGSYNDQKEAFS
jgi:2-oxoglutarate ferredoxin oxidoreductase subunit gamma